MNIEEMLDENEKKLQILQRRLDERSYCDWGGLWFRSRCIVECEKCHWNICIWCMKHHKMCPNCKLNEELDIKYD